EAVKDDHGVQDAVSLIVDGQDELHRVVVGVYGAAGNEPATAASYEPHVAAVVAVARQVAPRDGREVAGRIAGVAKGRIPQGYRPVGRLFKEADVDGDLTILGIEGDVLGSAARNPVRGV